MDGLALPWRILAFVGLAAATHVVVLVIRHVAAVVAANTRSRRYRKLRSISTLVSSALVFTLYFLAFGLILRELGVSLTAYFASASIVGLAVAFGSQGVVQDVMTGLTLIFSDLIDVGDLVEVSGQTGIVRSISMRFVELENALGASVFIPNRTINNVINYPRGYVRCLVDVTLLGDAAQKRRAEEIAARLMYACGEQFPGILMRTPSVEGKHRLESGKEFLRLKFRIWPHRGGPIETSFTQELVDALKRENPEYQSWMIAVTYEIEGRPSRPGLPLPWLPRGRRRRGEDGERTSAMAKSERRTGPREETRSEKGTDE